MRHRLLLTALILAAVSTASAQDRPQSGDQQMLAPGDSVRVMVFGRPELSGDFVVGPDQTAMHPWYRKVRVGGVPFATAEANIRTALMAEFKDPFFVFEPFLHVAVSGEVFRSQVMAVPPQTTISEAITRTGGLTQYADRNHVRVTRTDPSGAQREFLVDLDHADRSLSLSPVRSGDMIYIKRKRVFLRDVLVPAISVAGSIAALGLLIDRYTH